MTRTIEIVVSPKGETNIETKGYSGSECREASKFIEQALGTSLSDKTTQEFYQSESSRIENQQRT